MTSFRTGCPGRALGPRLDLLAPLDHPGWLAGWLAARLFSSAVLAPHTPVVLTWSSAAALAGGFAGGVLASIAACYRTLTRGVLAQWRRTTRSPRASRAGLVVDVAVSVAAVAGLVVLRTGSAHRTAMPLIETSAGLLHVDLASLFEQAATVVGRPGSVNLVVWLTRAPEDGTLASMGFVESSDEGGFRYEFQA